MSIKKLITGLALSMLLASGVVSADGNELLANCQRVVNFMDSGGVTTDASLSFGRSYGRCTGMAEGVRNTMIMYNLIDLPTDSTIRACFPEEVGINNGQAARIITSFLKNKPSLLHLDESFLAIYAFVEAYPCK